MSNNLKINKIGKGKLIHSFSDTYDFELYDSYIEINSSSVDLVSQKDFLSNIFYTSWFESKSVLDLSNTNSYFAFWSAFKAAGKISALEKEDSKFKELVGVQNRLDLEDFNIIQDITDIEEHDLVIWKYNSSVSIDQIRSKAKELLVVFFDDQSDLEKIVQEGDRSKDYQLKNSSSHAVIIYLDPELDKELKETRIDTPLQDIFLCLNEKGKDYFILRNWEIVISSNDVFGDLTLDVYLNNGSIEEFESKLNNVLKVNVNGKLVYQFPIGKMNGNDVYMNIKVINEENQRLTPEFLDELKQDLTRENSVVRLSDNNYLKYLIHSSLYNIGGADLPYLITINQILRDTGNSTRINDFTDIYVYAKENGILTRDYNNELNQDSLSYIVDPKNVIESERFSVDTINFIRRVYQTKEGKLVQVPKPVGQREYKLLSKLLNEESVFEYTEREFESYYVLNSTISVTDPHEFYERLLLDENQDPDPESFKDLIFFDDAEQRTVILTGNKKLIRPLLNLCERLGVSFSFDISISDHQNETLNKSIIEIKDHKKWWGTYFDTYENVKDKIAMITNPIVITSEDIELKYPSIKISEELLSSQTEEVINDLLEKLGIEIPKDNLSDFVQLINQSFTGINKRVEEAALKANEYIQEEDYENALNEIDYLIENSGRLSEGQKILYVKAICLTNLGKVEEALNYVNQEIILNPDNEDAYDLKDELEKQLYKFNYNDVKKKVSDNDLSYILIGNFTDEDMVKIKAGDLKKEIIELNEFDSDLINEKIRNANSENIIILDACYPDCDLDELIKTNLDSDPDTLFGAKILYNNMVFHAGYVWGPVARDLKMPYLIYPASNPLSPQVQQRRNFQFVGAGFLAFKKELFDKIEGFDTEFKTVFNYFDLCMKAQTNGFQVVYDPEIQMRTKKSLIFLSELTNAVVEDKNSTASQELKRFKDKWGSMIQEDDASYYEEDMMWGLSSEEHKFKAFQAKIKELFEKLKGVPEEHYQTIAQDVSEFFFGRKGVDFTGSPELMINISYKQMLHAEEFLNNRIDEIVTNNRITENNEFFDEDISTDEPVNIASNDSNIRFSNNKAIGKLPDPLPSPLKINVGCGLDLKDNYINIDLFSDDPRVVAMDVRELDFKDHSVDEIHASDILEHFSHNQVDEILAEWSRVLKPGGTLFIRCPNLKLQMQAYLRGDWDADVASYMIFGGQTNPGDYHFIAFDEQSIKKHLQRAGFEVTSYKELDYPQDRMKINLNMEVTAKRKAIENYGKKEINEIRSMFDDNKKEIKKHDDLKPKTPKLIKRRDDQPQLNIVWEGSQFIYHSLALINREICYNIIRSDVAELSIIPYEQDTFQPFGNKKFELLYEKDVRHKEAVSSDIAELPYVWIRHQWPPKDEPPIGARWIIMQPWEFSSLRTDFVELFGKADEIWTPSTFSRNAFVNSGVDANKVQVIPNGIDPDLFKPFGDKYKLKTNKKLKLLYLGGTIPRKGIDVLLEAYFKTFTSEDDICLVVKDMGVNSFYAGQNAGQHIKKFIDDKQAAEIEYIEDDLTEEELASLYRACDVFVSPYRGEGFSLPTLEAMASGLPVIVTSGGATDDFVSEHDGWKIPSTDKNIGNEIGGFKTADTAYLLEPDKDALAMILNDIYTNPGRNFTTGLMASYKARTNWTWRRSTMKIFSRLDSLYGTKMSMQANKKLVEAKDDFIKLGEAEDLFMNGDFEDALEIYNSISSSKDIPQDYLTHASILCTMQIGNIDKAIELLDNIDNEFKDHPDTIYLKAIIASEKGDTTQALENYTELLEKWADNKWKVKLGLTLDNLMCDTAKLMYDHDDLEGALQLYQNAMSVNKLNALAYYGAGMCFKKNEQEEEADNCLNMAYELDPNIGDLEEIF